MLRLCSEARGLAFISCCTASRSVQPLHFLQPSMSPTVIGRRAASSVPSGTAAHERCCRTCAPARTERDPAPVSVQAARRRHRDGRQPAALEATPRVVFKAFTARKTRAKKRKSTPQQGAKQAVEDCSRMAQGHPATGLTPSTRRPKNH